MIAWQGELELLNASWNLDVGRVVEFRLIEEPGVDRYHPFKTFQTRRGGRMGQRFHFVLVPNGSEQAIYDGEVMFCGWSDSNKGQAVKFWVDEDASTHPLAGFKRRNAKEVGSLFAGVFVVIDDDGSPVSPNPADRANEAKRPRPLSAQAHLIITGSFFCQWLTEKSEWTARLYAKGLTWTPEVAKRYVKFTLGIESLSVIDQDPQKAELFHELIRKPFARWRENAGPAGGRDLDQGRAGSPDAED